MSQSTKTYLTGVIEVERRSDDWMAFLSGDRKIWGCGSTPDEAIGAVIHTHTELIAKAVIKQSAQYIAQLQGALQMTAHALQGVLAGTPVSNVPHCMAAAESLLKGTNFEL